ncbi:MAG: hypothetical protein H6710_22290 [Myxococcales bacterium]|nr:hypothetical protein [Myxococcales bacterium]
MTMINLLTGIAPSELPSRRLRPVYHDRVAVGSALLGFIDRLIEPVPDDRFEGRGRPGSPSPTRVTRGPRRSGRRSGSWSPPASGPTGAQEEQEALARRTRQAAEARLARRPPRVAVQRGEGRIRVTIAPPLLVDQLRDQVIWGMVFAFFNPGAFIVITVAMYLILGLEMSAGVAIPLTITLWIVLLGLLNVGYAQLRRRPWYVDLSDDGLVAVHRGDPRKGALLGRAHDLSVRLSTPDPARLGSASFQGSVEIEYLTARDLKHLGEALRSRVRVT